jgi:transcriptional regulator with XRE-family HTH domain
MNATQCRMARAALGWTTRELAARLSMGPSTIVRLEAGGEMRQRTLNDIRATFEAAGVRFVDTDTETGAVISTGALGENAAV